MEGAYVVEEVASLVVAVRVLVGKVMVVVERVVVGKAMVVAERVLVGKAMVVAERVLVGKVMMVDLLALHQDLAVETGQQIASGLG